MTEELKPCPFCGRQPALLQNFKKTGYFVVCNNHGLCVIRPETYDYPTADEAIDAWNTRADTQEA